MFKSSTHSTKKGQNACEREVNHTDYEQQTRSFAVTESCTSMTEKGKHAL